MNGLFSDRMQDVPRSFIREILKVTTDPDIISFAGGLPNRAFFPIAELLAAADRVFAEQGADCLQYSNSEGLKDLRIYIAGRYAQTHGIRVDPEQILITNGSQQALDLLAKVMLNDGEEVVIEEPGYLGAIQALSLYRPRYLPVPVHDDGMDVDLLAGVMEQGDPRLMYTVPNFQNPSGISYSMENRQAVAEIVGGRRLVLIEDDPYGALRFRGETIPSFYHLLPQQTVLLGSFSKIVVPGFRLGWVVAPAELFEKLLIAKQAADLHTCNFTQYILLRYLQDNDLEGHISRIVEAYGRQCRAMVAAIDRLFPPTVSCTRPEGGMFLWGRLPDGLSAMDLFERAVKRRVVFVPGEPFYTRSGVTPAFRLNFSCVDEPIIEDGIARLAEVLDEMLTPMSSTVR
ncbi:MAG: PLP-dependent aminotransferase family protein [Desulfofustis sp.]|nr:PLP-dependent aminotransferase family protein [Desulfofustis sp.]